MDQSSSSLSERNVSAESEFQERKSHYTVREILNMKVCGQNVPHEIAHKWIVLTQADEGEA